MSQFVDQQRYNSFVQNVQEEAAAFGLETRVRAHRRDDGALDATFEVFWDRWQTLGVEQNAMTPEARRSIEEPTSTAWIGVTLWDAIKTSAAAALAKG